VALTITPVSQHVAGDRKVVTVDAVWDSSATAGGEAITASDVGLSVIESIAPSIARDPDTVDNAVLVGYLPTDDISGTLMPFYGDYSNASDGPFIEAATVDLSAYTSRLVIVGY
jgi:hypothetical protein